MTARSGYFRATTTVSAAIALAVLVAVVVTLVAPPKPAEAAFPGQNGKMVFASTTTAGEGVDNPEGDSEIFTIDPDGTDLDQITRNETYDGTPEWSADGDRIAYTGFDGDYEIYTVPAAGGTPTRVTDNAGYDADPTWSPDGKTIAYSADDPEGRGERQIFTIDTSGDDTPARLSSLDYDGSSYYTPYDLEWSPDGKTIAYTQPFSETYSGGNRTIAAPGGSSPPIFDRTFSYLTYSPEWAPDGQKIVYGVSDFYNEVYDLYTAPVGGGTPTKVTDSPSEYEGSPAWSPDGSKISFTTGESSGRCSSTSRIHTMPAGGGAPTEIVALPGSVSSLDWGVFGQDADPPDPGTPPPDTKSPTVLCTDPQEGSDYAYPDATTAVDFSEEMDESTLTSGTFYLTKEGSEEPIEATVSCEGDPCRTAVLDPIADLDSETTYTATVEGGDGGAEDKAGNALAADETWSFATRDTTPPTISITEPEEGATISGSSVTISVEASDSSGIYWGGVNFYVNDRYVGDDRTAGGESGEEYSITWDSGTVADGPATIEAFTSDGANNRGSTTTTVTVDNVADPTDTTPPRITDVSPDNRKDRVSRDTNVTATFSEEMDPTALNAETVKLVRAGSGKPVKATVSCDEPCKTVTLDPSGLLKKGTRYKAVVTTGAEDKAGNPLAERKVWSFTTGRSR